MDKKSIRSLAGFAARVSIIFTGFFAIFYLLLRLPPWILAGLVTLVWARRELRARS